MNPEDVPVEVFLRRKELLDATNAFVELVEPGFSRRRGKTHPYVEELGEGLGEELGKGLVEGLVE